MFKSLPPCLVSFILGPTPPVHDMFRTTFWAILGHFLCFKPEMLKFMPKLLFSGNLLMTETLVCLFLGQMWTSCFYFKDNLVCWHVFWNANLLPKAPKASLRHIKHPFFCFPLIDRHATPPIFWQNVKAETATINHRWTASICYKTWE